MPLSAEGDDDYDDDSHVFTSPVIHWKIISEMTYNVSSGTLTL